MIIAAVDTETIEHEAPWSVQTARSDYPFAEMYYCDMPSDMSMVKELLERDDVLTVLHNAKYDLKVLYGLDIHPIHTECTMQMAYLAGEMVLSLKVLAYRIAGIVMRTYEEVTYQAGQIKAEAYLRRAMGMEWPNPDPTMKITPDGDVKYSFPKNIHGKIEKLLGKYMLDPSINLSKKWKAMDEEGGRGQVESKCGKMQPAYLSEVDKGEAEQYAKLDAEATLAIYPYLHDRITELGLQEVLQRDMDSLPMIIAMELNGTLVDTSVLHELSEQLEDLISDTQTNVNYLFGKHVNPNSPLQVAEMLYIMGVYEDADMSTDSSTLDQFRGHTVVKKIQDYRGYSKLKSTYADKLAKIVGNDGRIHTQFSTTRTETGRLASSNPNLQNIPVRTELGRQIRKAFIAERAGNVDGRL